jgi:small-conductance mechanosensitive channel
MRFRDRSRTSHPSLTTDSRRLHVLAADPARFVARVRPDYRRAVAAAMIALAAAVAGRTIEHAHFARHYVQLVTWLSAGVFVVFGVAATRLVANEAGRVTAVRAGPAAGGPVRVFGLLGGYVVVTLVALDLLHLPLGHLLVGGAITGIILGIAAQQTLGNLFAGLVLLFTRPYIPGERIVVRSGALNGPLVGTITGIGLLYTTLQMDDGATNIPNSALLASAVGPASDEDALDALGVRGR